MTDHPGRNGIYIISIPDWSADVILVACTLPGESAVNGYASL